MIIVFTGHRDKQANENDLAAIAARFPGSVWMHGGAIGFDSQVARYAAKHGIPVQAVLPDYARFPSKVAPLRRNTAMVAQAGAVVALWDGRERGGTFDTITKARRAGLAVILLAPGLPLPIFDNMEEPE